MPERPILTRSTPTPLELEYLEDRLYDHNRAKTGRDDGQLFAFFVRDAQQEISAGISGWTWASACEIRTLWVREDLRGQGLGSQLLQAAEDEASQRGCALILLSSFSFQAPGFYQKHGFQLEWQLDGFPPGHQFCFLVKRLAQDKAS